MRKGHSMKYCQKHSQSEFQKQQDVKQIIKTSLRFKPQRLQVLIMQCICIRSFCFYLDQILMLFGGRKNKLRASEILWFDRSDISMLSSKYLSFYQMLNRSLQQFYFAETIMGFSISDEIGKLWELLCHGTEIVLPMV